MGIAVQRTSVPARAIALLVAVFMVLSLAPVVPVQAIVTTWYVDVATGDDDNPGTADEPFKSITAGLAAAEEGDTVMVAPGVYSPAEEEEPNGEVGSLEASGEEFPLAVPAGVTLVSSGGSAETIIDGEYKDGRSLISVDERDGVTVEGFTVTRGLYEAGGGALVMDSDDVVFRDVVFKHNIALGGGGLAALGSSVTLEHCVFVGGLGEYEGGNEIESLGVSELPDFNAYFGGGLLGYGAELELHECDFEDNVAVMTGAGAFFVNSMVDVHGGHVVDGYVTGEADIDIVASLEGLDVSGVGEAAGSWAEREGDHDAQPALEDFHGAGFAFTESMAYVHGVAFHGNGAPVGGAIWSDLYSDLEVSECSFEENYAITGSAIARTWGDGLVGAELDGLAIEALEIDGPMWEPGIFVDKSVFGHNYMAYEVLRIDNFAHEIRLTENGDPIEHDPATVVNCLFHDNESMFSVVSVQGTEIWNSTFAHNDMHQAIPFEAADVSDAGRYGAATASLDASSSVVNGLFWGNTAEDDYYNDVGTLDIANGLLIDVAGGFVAYTNTEHGIDAYETGDGNISEDPLYFDPAGADYRLLPASPCIDAGTNDGAPDDDLLGQARPYDGDFDGVAVTDMGAYEYVPEGAIRTGGSDRYDTAVRISRENFESSEVVIIARGDDFADGLASSGLAGLYGAPVLLTSPSVLPQLVAEEIQRLGAEHAIVAGGPVAVNPAVVSQIEGLGLTTDRIGGIDRYATAELIADEIEASTGDAEVVFLVRGDRFPDALTVSPVAYGIHAPILLARPAEMPDAGVGILEYVDADTSVYIMGGTDAVSAEVEALVGATTESVQRIGGADRHETSVLFSDFAVEEGWATYVLVGIATGQDFPDALAGGAAVGSWGGVLMLTRPTSLHPMVEAALEDNKAAIFKVEVFGGPMAVSAAVMSAIEAALGH